MGRLLALTALFALLAPSPLRTSLDARHVFAGQRITLTVHVRPEPEWRQLTIVWYDAEGFLASATTRELGDREQGGQFFSAIRPANPPGTWQAVVELSHSRGVAHRSVERFEVIPP